VDVQPPEVSETVGGISLAAIGAILVWVGMVRVYPYIHTYKGKGGPYSITERGVPDLIPVLGSQPAGDVSYKPGGRLPLLSVRSVVTIVTLKRAATNFVAW